MGPKAPVAEVNAQFIGRTFTPVARTVTGIVSDTEVCGLLSNVLGERLAGADKRSRC